MKISFVLAATALAFGTMVTAHAGTTHLDKRQAHQEKRIEQGLASGSLTKHEAKMLNKREIHLEKAENRAELDGKVTRKERARLDAIADKNSQAIYRQKHDGQVDMNHDGKKDPKP